MTGNTAENFRQELKTFVNKLPEALINRFKKQHFEGSEKGVNELIDNVPEERLSIIATTTIIWTVQLKLHQAEEQKEELRDALIHVKSYMNFCRIDNRTPTREMIDSISEIIDRHVS